MDLIKKLNPRYGVIGVDLFIFIKSTLCILKPSKSRVKKNHIIKEALFSAFFTFESMQYDATNLMYACMDAIPHARTVPSKNAQNRLFADLFDLNRGN